MARANDQPPPFFGRLSTARLWGVSRVPCCSDETTGAGVHSHVWTRVGRRFNSLGMAFAMGKPFPRLKNLHMAIAAFPPFTTILKEDVFIVFFLEIEVLWNVVGSQVAGLLPPQHSNLRAISAIYHLPRVNF